MANKEVNELERINRFKFNDLLTVFDASISASRGQKVRSIRMENVSIPNYDLYGDNKLRIVVILQMTGDMGFNTTVRVSAYDFIKSVHGGDGSNIVYGLSKDGVEWTESTDPFACYLEYDCIEYNDNTSPFVYVRVKDGTTILPAVLAYISMSDTQGKCGA